MKNLISILGFIFLLSDLSGQSIISVTSDKDSVTIGEPFSVKYKIETYAGNSIDVVDFSSLFAMENLVFDQDTSRLDKTADIAVLAGGSLKVSESNTSVSTKGLWIQSGSTQKLETSLSIAIYNVGVFALYPSKKEKSNNSNEILLEPMIIIVTPPEGMQDSLSLAPIKPIIAEPVIWQDYLPYVYILAGFVALFFLGRYLFKSKKGEYLSKAPIPEIIPPPDIIALEKLKILKDLSLWERGEIKAYQSQLTYIIREYLEGRFDISALELTTGEILSALTSKDFDAVHAENLKTILQIADLIKFAKAIPTEDLHSRFMDIAVDFVEDTKKLNEASES